MDKRGELSTQQMVVLIILIASFGIILFFIARLNLGETSEQEICHNSVITRGSSVLPTGSVPLNCKRSYVCLTRDGSCESLTKPIKEKVETKEEVYHVLAEEMATCWWMFGEGKINYVGDDFFENLYCSICTQVAFDDSVQDIFTAGVVDKSEFYEYLTNNNVEGKEESYSEYLKIGESLELENTLKENDATFGSFDLSKQHYVFTGIYSDLGVWKWVASVAAAGAALGGIIAVPFTSGLSLGVTAAILTGGVAGGVGGHYIGTAYRGESGHDYLPIVFVEVNSPEFKSFKCKSITTLS